MPTATRLLQITFTLSVLAASLRSPGQPVFGGTEEAKYPVIVLGYVPSLKEIPYKEMSDEGGFFRLHVTHVIHGAVRPGLITLRRARSIAWAPDGSFTCFGPMDSVCLGPNTLKLSLWLLHWGPRLDPKDKTRYLTFDSSTQVQSPNLLPYIEALRQGKVARLLACIMDPDSDVAESAIDYYEGQQFTWPGSFPDSSPDPPIRSAPALKATALKAALHGNADIRSDALALFGRLAGLSGIPVFRHLLNDGDSLVRKVAAAFLVRFGDIGSISKIESACKIVKPDEDSLVACNLVQAMAVTHDVRYVPAIINFLEDRYTSASESNDLCIPAEHARNALIILTGCLFPYDVAISQKAWSEVQNITAAQRAQRLRELLHKSEDAHPRPWDLVGTIKSFDSADTVNLLVGQKVVQVVFRISNVGTMSDDKVLQQLRQFDGQNMAARILCKWSDTTLYQIYVPAGAVDKSGQAGDVMVEVTHCLDQKSDKPITLFRAEDIARWQ
jgi:hypothetical protein